jgi:ABC-type dipeptide/oligopeptide/nickel transport system ATPase component
MTTDNIEVKVQGNTLVITVDLSKEYGLSGSGKSVTVASTGGNVPVPGREDLRIGVNIYRPQKR